jgi:circadian clock protein KaiC
MTNARADTRAPLARVRTFVPNLDELMGGGFLAGSLNLIFGRPGTGKTVLGNQIAFAHAGAGGRVIYLTQLAETHDRMLSYLGGLSFFAPDVVGRDIIYLSGFQTIEQQGVAGLLTSIENAVRNAQASLIVIDELLIAELAARSAIEFKRFVHALQTFLSLTGATGIAVTTDFGTDGSLISAQPIVDGLIRLDYQHAELRAVREIEILKLRGSSFIPGRHVYEISSRGMVVYPRLEAITTKDQPSPPERPKQRFMTSGSRELDTMTGGGWPHGSTTLVLGGAGSGKTLLGLSFLVAGARQGQNGLLFGFYEPPEQLIDMAEAAGLPKDERSALGALEFAWNPRCEQLIDKLAADLLEKIRRRNVQRVFIDSMAGFESAALHPRRLSNFLGALALELRRLGVTSILSEEIHEPQGPEIRLSTGNIPAVSDNIVFLRCVERASQLYRLLTVRKLRSNAFDTSTREFWIEKDGIRLADSATSATKLLDDVGLHDRLPGNRP